MSKKMLRSFVSHSIAAIALGVAAMLPIAAMATVTVYVGGEGASDDNAGTSTKPYATIEKAMDKINAEGNANDCKVYVRAGDLQCHSCQRDESGFYTVEDGRAVVKLIFADEEKLDGISVFALELTTGKMANLALKEREGVQYGN